MISETCRGYTPENEQPASNNYLATIKPSIGHERKHRIVHEISAKHVSDPTGAFADEFKYIGRATEAMNLSWSEEIQCIFSAKESALSDEYASLFVCNKHMGSSFSSETWYQLSPDGTISEFGTHPYAAPEEKKIWETKCFWYHGFEGECVPFKKDGKCGYAYYDTDVIIIKPQWDAALPFHGDRAIVINGVSIEEIIAASDGAIGKLKVPEAVNQRFSYKTGLVDTEGNIILPAIFDIIEKYYREDVYVISLNSKWGVLGVSKPENYFNNCTNSHVLDKVILPVEYDEIECCGNHVYARRGSSWGIFDLLTGNVIIDMILTERPDIKSLSQYNKYLVLLRNGERYGLVSMYDSSLVQQPTLTKRETIDLVVKLLKDN